MTEFDIHAIRIAAWFLYGAIIAALLKYCFTIKPRKTEERRLATAMERIATVLDRRPGPH